MPAVSVRDLTVEELKMVVHEAVQESLLELLEDPDAGLELREEIAERLRHSLEAQRQGVKGIPAEQIAAELGLEW